MMSAANVVCQDTCLSPNALTVSGDSHLLAFVGPSKYTVTIKDASSLDNVSQPEPCVFLVWVGLQHPAWQTPWVLRLAVK